MAGVDTIGFANENVFDFVVDVAVVLDVGREKVTLLLALEVGSERLKVVDADVVAGIEAAEGLAVKFSVGTPADVAVGLGVIENPVDVVVGADPKENPPNPGD